MTVWNCECVKVVKLTFPKNEKELNVGKATLNQKNVYAWE